jgi:DNA topoisomerase-2
VVQAEATDFSNKAGPSGALKKPAPRKISQSMKPASPPKPKKAPPKRFIDSEDEDENMDYDEVPKAPARSAPPARAARGAPKKYIEVLSDDEGGDDSLFVDDD